MMVQHHTKYIELHGVDEVVEMTQSEHKQLHIRLRQDGNCNIPADELRRISHDAHQRSQKGKAYTAAYYIEHKEQINAKHRAYYAEHKEQIQARHKACYDAKKMESASV